MKVESYEIRDNNIVLKFDKTFQQIKYIKMTQEKVQEANNFGELECDETEIKFTKQKNVLDIYNNNYKLIVFLVKEIDNCPCYYSYFITIDNCDMKNDLMETGLAMLFCKGTADIGKGNLSIISESENKIKNSFECPIKNRNIFANIKRKSSKYGNATSN